MVAMAVSALAVSPAVTVTEAIVPPTFAVTSCASASFVSFSMFAFASSIAFFAAFVHLKELVLQRGLRTLDRVGSGSGRGKVVDLFLLVVHILLRTFHIKFISFDFRLLYFVLLL